MPVAVIHSPQFRQHATGGMHPERPERLDAIEEALQAAPWADRLQWQQPSSPQQRDALGWVQQLHSAEYVDRVQELAERGGGRIDADTVVSAQSYEVVLLAVSAWLDGVDWVLSLGEPAFVAARPPGHHAVRSRGMGFCLFGNAAIAAHYALAQPGIERVGILDWDVHHGNGTQHFVGRNPQIAYCSLHQASGFPGTGRADERGEHGNVLNLPMADGSTWAAYRPRLEDEALPFLQQFAPDLLIVSAGYDAHRDDPLASVALEAGDYSAMAERCLQLTPYTLLGLEGGYDLAALGESVRATLARCAGVPASA
ncbi:MAG: histone deacetylase [Cyanobacteria bacterium QS_8_64_29]|nr:MAG: histone deacetylase [Cyanobacteria bacterium QS_8_64_29]